MLNPAQRRLTVLIVLFVVGAWIYGAVLPPLEGGDEWLQVAYIEHLREAKTLPDRDAALISPVRQQSGQPPLTYAASALAATVLRLPQIDTQAMWDGLQANSNNWFTPPDQFNRLDNNNVFYLSNVPANDPDTARLNRGLRIAAPLWGIIGILAVYAAGWELWRNPRWALVAAGVFAFTPTYLHVNSFPNTDGGSAALGAVALWWALRGVRRGVDSRWALVAGLVLGLAGLAKVSAILIAPAVGLVLILQTWREPGRLLRLVALMALPFLLTFGAWVLWGTLTYSDPLGMATHHFEGQAIIPPLGLLGILERTPEILLSYWGKFASAVYLHPASYIVAAVWAGVAVIGGIFGRRTGQIPQSEQAVKSPVALDDAVWWVLWVAVIVAAAGLAYWIATINFITGRLMFPAHGAVVLLLVAGMRRLPAGTWVRAFAVGVPGITGLVIAPMVIAAAYRAPLPPGDDPTLTRTVIVYDDTIQLMGWHAPQSITSDDLTTVTLCWEVLATPERPAAYSLKLVRDGIPVGERTTVHGLGRYDWQQWEPGAAFCDALDVPVGTVDAGQPYDVLLVVLDAETGAVDWDATTEDGTPLPFPVLGQVVGR